MNRRLELLGSLKHRRGILSAMKGFSFISTIEEEEEEKEKGK